MVMLPRSTSKTIKKAGNNEAASNASFVNISIEANGYKLYIRYSRHKTAARD